jgi:hypothetical protein
MDDEYRQQYSEIGCWVFGRAILDMLVAGMLFSALDGMSLVVGVGVYFAVSVVVWAAFWYYRDEFK